MRNCISGWFLESWSVHYLITGGSRLFLRCIAGRSEERGLIRSSGIGAQAEGFFPFFVIVCV
jgi:hypothetical protein